MGHLETEGELLKILTHRAVCSVVDGCSHKTPRRRGKQYRQYKMMLNSGLKGHVSQSHGNARKMK